MTQDDINEIKDLLNDESDKWRLDVGDWMGHVEELLEEVDRLRICLRAIEAETQKGIRKQIIDTDICWHVRQGLNA